MPVLKEEVKLYITQCLACFDVPTQVVESVKEEFGLELERSHVQFYDPTKANGGKELGKKFVTVFNETRKAFLEDITKIPIASQSFRLRSLQRSYDFFTQRKNYVAANQVLEQAAREVGGFYTNKVKLGNIDDAPFVAFVKQISGNSLPVVEEGEFTEMKEVEAVAIEPPKDKRGKWREK